MRIVKVSNSSDYNIKENFATSSDLDFEDAMDIAERAQATLLVDAMVADGKTQSLDMATVQEMFGVQNTYAARSLSVASSAASTSGSAASTSSGSGSAASATNSASATSGETICVSSSANGHKNSTSIYGGTSYGSGVLNVPAEYKAYFEEAAATYGVDEKFLESIAAAESGFNADEVSSSGAVGIMQLLPETAADQGVTDSYDPYQNIMGGARYISYLMGLFDGDYATVASAYNRGQHAVSGVGQYASTSLNYVETVMEYYNS